MKRLLYEQVARVGKALAAPRRLELLDLLGQAPRTVEDLARRTETSIANASQHLQILRAAGLVASTKSGTHVRYRLASNDVAAFSVQLRSLAETQLAELVTMKGELAAAAGDLERVDAKELLARLRRGEVVLLDVRPLEEFDAGHIRGALSIPHDELKRRIDELPKGRRVIAYCRGPYCVFAVSAVKLLRQRGFDAARIEDGVTEWRARRLPVDATHRGAPR